ncbi:hypothetical protein [Francisella salimarina]|uniref:hypothetical protein n=1 Tax=Francisella salimarina TaxID=2599927 RepID=UPI0037532FD1
MSSNSQVTTKQAKTKEKVQDKDLENVSGGVMSEEEFKNDLAINGSTTSGSTPSGQTDNF